jgi:hypothetical protein
VAAMKKDVVYKDLETGITHYAKHNADARYKQGHRIRVYNQNCRTMKMKPIVEWIPGSNDYYCFAFGKKVRICCV